MRRDARHDIIESLHCQEKPKRIFFVDILLAVGLEPEGSEGQSEVRHAAVKRDFPPGAETFQFSLG